MKQRNNYFDYLRAIAILMVVGIHCYNSESQERDLLFVRNLLNCAVPLFLAVSGFFLGKKDLNTSKSHIDFLRVQIPKVYVPMLVWSLPFVYYNLRGGHGFWLTSINWLLGGLGVFYFIVLIIRYYILLPSMRKVLEQTGMGGVILTFFISEISIAIVIYLRAVCGVNIPLLLYAGFFSVWLVFYMAGIYLGRSTDRAYSIKLPLLIVLVGLILSQIESSYLVRHYGTGFGVKPSSFIYSVGMIFLLFSSRTENFVRKFLGDSNKLLIYIGNISFAIYLVHLVLLVQVVNRISGRWSVKWGLTLAISMMLIYSLKWIIPAKYHKYFGV